MNQTFKNVLKALGKSALESAGEVIPGLPIVIEGATQLFDKHNDNNVDGLRQIETGLIQAIESLSPDRISDPVLVKEGIAELESGFAKIRKGLKS